MRAYLVSVVGGAGREDGSVGEEGADGRAVQGALGD